MTSRSKQDRGGIRSSIVLRLNLRLFLRLLGIYFTTDLLLLALSEGEGTIHQQREGPGPLREGSEQAERRALRASSKPLGLEREGRRARPRAGSPYSL